MTADIIIAVRQELPENLRKTVANIKAGMGADDHIHIVWDGDQEDYDVDGADLDTKAWNVPRGCGQARHYGAKASAADVIVFVDGHMTFPAGWLKAIKAHLKRNPHDVTCCRMQSLDRNWQPIDGQLYHGAELISYSSEPHGHRYPLSAKWGNPGKTEGRIPAMMGACYGMTRDHYINGMGGPLKILEAWGGDEELLSVATWFAGGHVHLLPVTVGHMFAAPHTRKPATQAEVLNVWANRLAILQALPCPDDERAAMAAWLMRSRMPWDAIQAIAGARKVKPMPSVKARRWGTFKRHHIRKAGNDDQARAAAHQKAIDAADPARTTTPRAPAAPAGDVSQVIIRKADVCSLCNGVNTMMQIEGMRNLGAWSQCNARCSKCGHRAIIRELK